MRMGHVAGVPLLALAHREVAPSLGEVLVSRNTWTAPQVFPESVR